MTTRSTQAASAPPQAVRARQSPAGTLAPRRRVPLLVGGILLVLLCAGVFAVMQMSRQSTVAVLAIARPVPAGQQLAAADLRIAHVVPDPGVALVRAADMGQVVGRSPAVPLAEGSLLSPSQLGPSTFPASGQAVVAVAVKPGRAPAGLAAGAAVRVVTVAKDPTATGATGVVGSTDPISATVVEVSSTVDGTGTRVVSLLLSEADATRIAAAGSELALVLVGSRS